MKNQNETALITGATSGIGLEFARILASTGRRLVLVARTQEHLDRVAKELRRDFGVEVAIEPCDLVNEAERTRLIARLTDPKSDGFHEVDILVNNAGFGIEGRFTETLWDRERKLIDLNVTALVHLTKAFVRPMVKRGSGRVLQVASTAAFQPGPCFSVYFASKAFVLSFAEALAVELEGTGVTVTALCPGPTRTEFEKRLGGPSRLFNNGLPVAAAESVAWFGYRALMKGKRIAIHGRVNRFLTWLARVTPRGITLRVTGYFTSSRQPNDSRAV
jgi:short-subunit dehydrogenase